MVNVTAFCRNNVFHSAAMTSLGHLGTQFGNQKSSGNACDSRHHPRRDDVRAALGTHGGPRKSRLPGALCTAHARESLCCPILRFNDVFAAISLPISL